VYACPVCRVHLARVQHEIGIYWACARCGGRAVSMPLLRRLVAPDYAREVWRQAAELGRAGDRPCPVCEQHMVEVDPGHGTLDVCRRCHFVWFDTSQYEGAPEVYVPKPEPSLPQDALEVVARSQSAQVAGEFKRRYPQPDMEGAWQLVPGALGLPFEEDDRPLNRLPLVTWMVVLAIAATSAIGFLFPEVRADWSLDPDDPFRFGGLTLITSLGFSGGLFHVTSNLWFLAMFGDDVEDFLGHGSFAALLAVAGLIGGIAHVLLAPGDTPLVGASAAISGMVAFYGLRFPQAQLRYFRLYRWMTMPASLAVGFWTFSQLIGARGQISGTSDVSYVAHIAGAAVGLWFWFLWRRQDEVMPVRSG